MINQAREGFEVGTFIRFSLSVEREVRLAQRTKALSAGVKPSLESPFWPGRPGEPWGAQATWVSVLLWQEIAKSRAISAVPMHSSAQVGLTALGMPWSQEIVRGEGARR